MVHTIQYNILKLADLKLLLVTILIMSALQVSGQNNLPANEDLQKIQLEHLKAQIRYYDSQSNKNPLSTVLSSAIGTIIGAIIALSGVVMNSYRQAALEEKKWQRSRQDDIVKETRLAVADLTRNLSDAIQEMKWIAWYAEFDPDGFKDDSFKEYDLAMKRIWSAVGASQLILAALDNETNQKLTPLVQVIGSIDVGISKAGVEYETDYKKGLQLLAVYAEQCRDLRKQLVDQIANLLQAPDIWYKPDPPANPTSGSI